ncbi:porin family protein [Algoriphagus sp. CAU 1675]|uniref:porin family protein n=1 Tax=Algoriphagus sp. CAU 1675 TaxID=3032597 RepID=UPI0023DA9CFE|nr:porin family protein [Algoriphagus sp. CAU 1675]MDF2157540.1 porin family protein [Algoriphagus sp. CAU 1675]
MRKVLILFFVLGVIGSAQAQFGLRAGLSSANFAVTDFDATIGFHVGGYYQLETDLLTLEPGIQFSQKGYETINPNTNNLISESLSYIDIPVLVRYEVVPLLNVFAGPQAGLLAGRNYKEDGNNQTSTDPVKGYELAGVIGVGMKLPAGVNFQVSYDFGVTSLNYFDTDVKNRVLKISAGFDF